MAAYKDLVGQKITKVTSNPGEPKTGQMWYNSTSGSLKGLSVVKAFTSSSTYLAELFGQGGAGSSLWKKMCGNHTPMGRRYHCSR